VIALIAVGVLGLHVATAADAQTPGGRSDGAELLYAPARPASAQNAAFSPDGDTILFTQFHRGYNRGPAGLFRLVPGSGAPARILDEPGADAVNLPGAAWNGRTRRITFASDRRAPRLDMWTMDPDGGPPFRVTNVAARGGRWAFIEPTFSPDGDWIVFEAGIQRANEDNEEKSIFKVRADGRDMTFLTDGPRGGTDDRLPNWSPAGDRILFQRRRPPGDDWDLYTMAADGTDLRRVTDAPSSDTDASWSPDGRWIVYSTNYGGLSQPNIFVVSAEGGEPIRVTYNEASEDGAPSWSPDGRWIAFESHVDPRETSPSALWRIAAPAGTTR
jgi:TolB protein